MSAARGRRFGRARVGAALTAALCMCLLAAQAAGAAGSGRGGGGPAYARPSAVVRAAQAALRSQAFGPGAFHQTKAISRINLINGNNVVVDRRTVSLSVNVTN